MLTFDDLKPGAKAALVDMIEELPEPFPVVDGKPSENPSANPSENPSPNPRGRGSSTEVSTDNPPPPPSPAPSPTTSAAPRPPSAEVVPMRRDVEALCATLAEMMIRNGCKPPKITDKWRTEARLLLDKDGVTLNDAFGVLEWSQHDEFWRANIHSMPTFREKFDTLRLQAARGTTSRQSTTDQRTGDGLALADQLRAEGR